MTPESVHIVLSTTELGGLEKRLGGLFVHLSAQGDDVVFVLPRMLAERLATTTDCRDLFKFERQLSLYDGDESTLSSLRRHLETRFAAAPRGIFHYGLVSPLGIHTRGPQPALFTIPNARLAQYNTVGLLNVFGGVLRADRVDVLDPSVYELMRRLFPWRRETFTRTPASYVDLSTYTALPAAQKENLIVFSGLFSDEKQGPRLVRVIPDMLRRLDAAGVPTARVHLLGRNMAQQASITKLVRDLGEQRVRASYEPQPQHVLARAKVFLSLQRGTNYPSKSLLEAMACGCSPVVTDTRDSRRTAPERLASYVSRDFSGADLAAAIVPILRRTSAEHDARTAEARAFLSENFAVEGMARYYRRLYTDLRQIATRRIVSNKARHA